MTLRRAGWTGALLAWLGGAACAPLGGGSDPDTLLPASMNPGSLDARALGCWALSWALPEDPGPMAGVELPDSVSLEDPPLFGDRGRLVSPATQPGGRGFDRPRGSTDPLTWEMRYRTNRWWVDGDLVEVVFGEEGSAYWSLRLRLDDGLLRGAAGYYRRAGGTRAVSASVTARPFVCGFAAVGPGGRGG